ncbi:hypothetical protein PSPO01_04705 [Paraphaeosphaeria sporulosa]
MAVEDIGSIYAGKSRAPEAFRSAGLFTKLQAAGYEVKGYSALTEPAVWSSSTRQPSGARNESATVAACTRVSKAITDVLNEDRQPSFHLILSGECLYTPAILSAYWNYLRPTTHKIGIIYFDADADLYTPSDSGGSGNIAGMTLTHLTLRDGALDSMRIFCKPDGSGVVDETNIVLFGMNSQCEANKRKHLGHLFDNNFRVLTSITAQRTPEESAETALAYMREQGVDHIIVHLDVDVIDPGEFPLCNVPNWTGLGYAQTVRALNIFLGSRKCVGLSIAEVNPDHDPGLVMTRRLVDDVVNGLVRRSVHATLPWVGEEE